MKINKKKSLALLSDIQKIIKLIMKEESKHLDVEVHPKYKRSLKNLVQYRILRTLDLNDVQNQLGYMGLSRLARAESHVLTSLLNAEFILANLLNKKVIKSEKSNLSIKKAQKLMSTHTKDLLGYQSKDRRVRIMVTMPSEAAHDYQLVHDLLVDGMNTARINCAHDGPEEWMQMIQNIKKAREKTKKNCKISMDLAGPKIRTGPIQPGPMVRKFRPKKNEFGRVVEQTSIQLVPFTTSTHPDEIPVNAKWLSDIEVDDVITLIDTRGKSRKLTVTEIGEPSVSAILDKNIIVQTGTQLYNERNDSHCAVGEMPAKEKGIVLRKGDVFKIVKTSLLGQPALYNEENEFVAPAFVSCTSAEIFDDVKTGEKILFDDGKITGIIKQVQEDEILLTITQAKENGTVLRSDKGINLPDTELNISGLTAKDKKDLEFIAEHADIVNFSFVNSPQDVIDLREKLQKIGAPESLGVVYKIETKSGFNNLTEIIMEGMKNYPFGVMIARGDLAVEVGWENIAKVQQEILTLCGAAHVPVIWATQVLENLAKKGIPSRSEISDVVAGLNAECIMLNKGPFILKAVNLLDYMLKSMKSYRYKNLRMTPKLKLESSKSNGNEDKKKHKKSPEVIPD